MKAQAEPIPLYSLIIPAYQEEFIIGDSLEAVADYLKTHKMLGTTEVIVVSAEGKDRTHDIVRSKQHLFANFVFVEPGQRVGKGRDVRAGVLAARGNFILFTDADLATPIDYVLPAFKALERGNDVVIGIRDLKLIHKGFRRFVSLTANTISRTLIAPTIADTQCGFKGFTREAAIHLFGKQTVLGWAFDMEIIFIARNSRMRIEKIRIPDWRENKPETQQLAGDSNLKAAIKTFSEVIKIRLNALRGLYRD